MRQLGLFRLLGCAWALHPSAALAQLPPPAPPPPPPIPAEPPPAQPAPAPAAPPETAPAPPPETAPMPPPEAAPQPVEPPVPAEAPAAATGPRMEIYGFAMTDIGYDFKQVDPAWFDVLRPTRLPSFEDEFGPDGQTWLSVRQSRFGVKGYMPTSLGEVRTTFEFEMFGVGADAGQTTFRLRHFYGELGQVGAGQYWSPFMDIDVFPNSLEYWGPPGMAFFRNVQIRYMPIQGDTRLTIALERPGASPDTSVYEERLELANVRGRFRAPDVSAEFRYGAGWGYAELAGILRWIEWDDLNDQDALDLDGDVLGWGLSLSSNVKLYGKSVLKLQAIYGQAIQNYMNDAGPDVGIDPNPGDPVTPIEGEALPVLGIVAFVDWYWTDWLSSAAGYSRVDVDNSEGQAPSAFQTGQYALGNVLFYPTDNIMTGAEFQWGRRSNNSDGFSSDDFRIQASFKYSFSAEIGGK